MVVKYLGIDISRKQLRLLGIESSDEDEDGKPSVFYDDDMAIENENPPSDYFDIFKTLKDFIDANGIDFVITKSSSGKKTPNAELLPLLEVAEVRGIVYASAQSSRAEVIITNQSSLNKSFGVRTSEGYVNDTEFWKKNINGKLRKESKTIALHILSIIRKPSSKK